MNRCNMAQSNPLEFGEGRACRRDKLPVSLRRRNGSQSLQTAYSL